MDFVYETIISKVCINFENAKENSDGLEHFQYNNVQTFTEFAVADILADAPALTSIDDTHPAELFRCRLCSHMQSPASHASAANGTTIKCARAGAARAHTRTR